MVIFFVVSMTKRKYEKIILLKSIVGIYFHQCDIILVCSDFLSALVAEIRTCACSSVGEGQHDEDAKGPTAPWVCASCAAYFINHVNEME